MQFRDEYQIQYAFEPVHTMCRELDELSKSSAHVLKKHIWYKGGCSMLRKLNISTPTASILGT